MGKTLRQPLAPGLEHVDDFASSGTVTNKQLGRGLVTEIFGDAASDKRGYRRALREALALVERDKYDLWGDLTDQGNILDADSLTTKLDEMLKKG